MSKTLPSYTSGTAEKPLLGMTIGEIRVTEKEGGASGAWQLPR